MTDHDPLQNPREFMASPYVPPETPRVALACGCALGEEVVWDARSEMLIWVDIEDPAVWRFWPSENRHERQALDEKISFALLTTESDVVVAGFKSGVALLDLRDGARRPLVTPDPHPAGNRLNSGWVGADSTLYFGTMDDAETSETGSFHRWDGDRLLTFGGRAAVTNGPVLSPDGVTLYTVDTAGGVIRRHTFEGDRIGDATPLVRFEAGWGNPDGITLDAEGYLWVCHYNGSRITRFAPDGQVDRVLPVPTPYVTKCNFGGPDLTTLYITTARRGRDPQIDPMAGHLFAVEAGIRGFAGNLFGLNADFRR